MKTNLANESYPYIPEIKIHFKKNLIFFINQFTLGLSTCITIYKYMIFKYLHLLSTYQQ